MKIVDRDRVIVSEINRWRYLLGRQVLLLSGFSGQRATDRRINKLITEHFLVRKHILYGLPGLYFVTKATEYFGLELYPNNVRTEHINHDIAVVDTAINFIYNTGEKITDYQ